MQEGLFYTGPDNAKSYHFIYANVHDLARHREEYWT